jgi:trimeric autotransporter adhesin
MANKLAGAGARPSPQARLRGGFRLPILALLAGGLALAGCQSRTNVSATGNTAAQFTHVFVTINQIWFNTSATALATDSSWNEFTLSTPQTVDLVNLSGGTLSQFASNLKLATGTYAQVMLILADSTDALTSTAESAGAATNDEVDYIDAADVAHTVPLAVLNAAQGISISTNLTVSSSTSTGFGSPTTASTTTTSSDDAITTSSAASTTTPSSGNPTALSAVVATTNAIIDFDATRDLVPISLSGQAAYALNPHPQVLDEKYSGTIGGTISLTGVTTLTTAGNPDVQVAAESLSTDGTRHVIVKTTRVNADGSFSLYPLSTASGAPSSYDLVVHGPTIETTIIKSVPVTTGDPTSATAVLGTLTLTAATPFLVNFNTSSPAAPTSSRVGFYQTLPLDSEVPYLVEMRAVDPTSGLFATDQDLSGGSLQYGTYVSGGTISLTNVNPSQGVATYAIGAINPAYALGSLGTTVTAPASASATALFTMTAPPVPSGSTANSITGTVTVTSPGSYDNATLFLTNNGALVAAAPLTGYLSGSASLSLSAVAPTGIYNAEVWAWNSANPAGTLTRVPYGSTIDMSAGNASGVALTLP